MEEGKKELIQVSLNMALSRFSARYILNLEVSY